VDLSSRVITSIIGGDDADSDDDFAVSDDDYPQELGLLMHQYAQIEDDRLATAVENTTFDETSTIKTVIGHPRLELVSLQRG
jgi:hypothetical protein